MGVFERFGKLPDDMQALVDVQILALLPEQEVESNCLSIMIKYQGRAEFGLLVVTNFQDSGVIYPLQDLKLSCRMPNEGLARLFCCCGGECVDPNAAMHGLDADVLTFPILEVLPFTDNSAKLIFADAAMLVRLPYPSIDHRSRKCACLLVIDPPRTLRASDTIQKYGDDARIIGSAGLATKAYPSTCVSGEFAVEA